MRFRTLLPQKEVMHKKFRRVEIRKKPYELQDKKTIGIAEKFRDW